MRVADYIAQFIEQLGVKHVFMVTGGGMMFLSDGVAANKNLSRFLPIMNRPLPWPLLPTSKYTQNWGAAFLPRDAAPLTPLPDY